MKYDSNEARAFLENFSSKSYLDIFNIRSRVEQRDWERFAISDVKDEVFSIENKFPRSKNVLYVHIPFCMTRCGYCPYYTEPYDSRRLVGTYLEALDREIDGIKRTPYLQSTRFASLYWGGGTPSVLHGEEIAHLYEKIASSFHFEAHAEMSFEANPATLTESKIATLARVGFNRVSLGVQTFSSRLLREMECAHTPEHARRVIENVLDAGLTVNIDCIYGLIGQTSADVDEDVDILSGFGRPIQITYFPLRIAENTPLHAELAKRGGMSLREHQTHLLELDLHIEKRLTGNGFEREECPVFYHSKGGADHKYHSTETRVVGVGSSAGTLLDRGESSNFPNVSEYIAAVANGQDTALSGIVLNEKQAHERFVLYRILYMNRSLPDFRKILDDRFQEYYGKPVNGLYEKVLNDMVKLRFAKVQGERVILTDRLWHVLNRVKIGMPSIL
jgi:oxygen-independent coproporphyrinogen-3 oxidase